MIHAYWIIAGSPLHYMGGIFFPDCRECPDNFVQLAQCTGKTSRSCKPCSNCTEGMKVKTVCTNLNDTVCEACTPCGPGKLQKAPCSGTSETVCEACPSCGENKYAKELCEGTKASVCADCAPACAAGNFEKRACGNDNKDRECGPCRGPCGTTEFIKQACGGASDLVCQACKVCGANEIETVPCDSTKTTDRECRVCLTCQAGSQFETKTCEPTNTDPTKRDRVCSACKVCAATEFEATPCAEKADRTCKACTVCPGGAKTACTATADTVCS